MVSALAACLHDYAAHGNEVQRHIDACCVSLTLLSNRTLNRHFLCTVKASERWLECFREPGYGRLVGGFAADLKFATRYLWLGSAKLTEGTTGPKLACRPPLFVVGRRGSLIIVTRNNPPTMKAEASQIPIARVSQKLIQRCLQHLDRRMTS
jgi:hypothetical protein